MDKQISQQIEWEAWKEVVEELGLNQIDINEKPSLNKALRNWAEAYHELMSA